MRYLKTPLGILRVYGDPGWLTIRLWFDAYGTAYNSIADLNVSIEGYLVEADAGDNPAEAWGVVGE